MELKWAAAAVAGILLAVLCVWLTAVFIKWLSSLDWRFESASERAGRHGEEIAAEIISRVLREGDHLLTNIEIKAGEKPDQAVKKADLSAGALPSEPSNQSLGGWVCYPAPSKQPRGQRTCHFQSFGY